MLYRLEIENFFSIRDPQVIDLTVASGVSDPDGRYAPIFPGSEARAPKVVALYGANASGKTTVLKALEFLVGFIRDSATKNTAGFPLERFNDEASQNRPIRMAMELGGIMNYNESTAEAQEKGETIEMGTLRYELEIAVKDGVAQGVTFEALRQRPQGKGKWQRVVERDASGVQGSTAFKTAGFTHLVNTLRPNVSVIASYAFFQHPTAMLYTELAAKVFMYLHGNHTPNTDNVVISFLASNPQLLERLNRDLGRIDVGVEHLRFEDSHQGPIARFKHSGLEVEMPWMLESQGTQAFIRLFPILALTLDVGGVALVDEFDTLIHPLVLPEILRWFYDVKTRNRSDAQVWLSCHSATLLEELTKEEVVIAEKDSRGRTTLFSLMDVKSVRRDDNLYKKYLGGAYGGVPVIG